MDVHCVERTKINKMNEIVTASVVLKLTGTIASIGLMPK
jgi:hypothetical protein